MNHVSNHSYFPYSKLTEAEKQSIQNIDYVTNRLEEDLIRLEKVKDNNHGIWAVKVAKLRRERLIALAALARSKVMYAEMQVFAAENELRNLLAKHEGEHYRGTPASKQQRYSPYSRSYTSYRSSTPSLSSRNSASSSNMSNFYNSSSMEYIPANTSNYLPAKKNSYKTNLIYDANKSTSTMSQSPMSTDTNKEANSTSSNQLLTASIIAEFNKPYHKTNYSTSIRHTSIPNQSVSMQYKIPKKRSQNVKINPVSNMDEYKKSYTHSSLSYNSHVLYTPNVQPNVRPRLHPRDPRAYHSKLSLEATVNPIPMSPMRLPVPPMRQNKNVLNQTKQPEQNKCRQDNTPTSIKQEQNIKCPNLPSSKQVEIKPYVPPHIPNYKKKSKLSLEAKISSLHKSSMSISVPPMTPNKSVQVQTKHPENNMCGQHNTTTSTKQDQNDQFSNPPASKQADLKPGLSHMFNYNPVRTMDNTKLVSSAVKTPVQNRLVSSSSVQAHAPRLPPVKNPVHTNMVSPTLLKIPAHTHIVPPTPIKNYLEAHLTSSSPVNSPVHLANSTPIKQSDTQVETLAENDKISVPTAFSLLHCHDSNSSEVDNITPPKNSESRYVLESGSLNVEHRPLRVSTPQKWFENKHIHVPAPPAYRHGTKSFGFDSHIKRGMSRSLNKLSSDSKINRPNSPTRVCFYHSS